jgi:hypothetical protein
MLDEIFKKIQASQTSQAQPTRTKNENIVQLEPGNTYIVRLIPFIKKPENTFVSFSNHGWESRKNGRYISIPCLKTWGRAEKCPTCEIRFAELKIGTEAAKTKARLLRQKTTNYVNLYMIETPNAEDKGKVKILRYGAELDKIIKAAVTGEDADEFGMRVFDLSPDGVDFRIKVDTKGQGKEAMPTYAMSKFISKKHDLGLSSAEIQAIYDSAHDLTAMVPERKSDSEIEKVLNEHYFTGTDRPAPVTEYVSDEEENDIRGGYQESRPSYQDDDEPVSKTISATPGNIDDKVTDLLKEFSLPTE